MIKTRLLRVSGQAVITGVEGEGVSGAQTLIETVFHDWTQENLPTATPDDAWELFTAWLLLRDSDATLDAIQNGIVDGGNDGGIDALYTLLEGGILPPDHLVVENARAARDMTEGLDLSLYVIQAKNNTSFPQSMVTALQSILVRALDLSKDLGELKDELNESAAEQLDIFRTAYRNLLARRPKVAVRVVMSSRGLTDRIADNVSSRAQSSGSARPSWPLTCGDAGSSGEGKSFRFAGAYQRVTTRSGCDTPTCRSFYGRNAIPKDILRRKDQQ
jgi:hypothetical protein